MSRQIEGNQFYGDELEDSPAQDVSAYLWPDHDQYRPLIDAVGDDLAQQFEWRAETGTIQTYEHRETFRYVHIDSVSGCFFDQQCNVITKETAFAHAMPRAKQAVSAPPPAPEFPPASEFTPASELGLGAFTRADADPSMQESQPDQVPMLDRLPGASWSNGIATVLRVAKSKFPWLRRGDAPDYPRVQDHPEHATEFRTPDFQEPSIATFMRRTSKLES